MSLKKGPSRKSLSANLPVVSSVVCDVAPPLDVFNYDDLPVAVGQRMRITATLIRQARTAHAKQVFEIGSLLLSAKRDLLKHGDFQLWLSREVGMEPRVAQYHMRVAEVLGDKSEIVSHLQPTTLYKLSRKSFPAEARQKLLDALAAGEHVDDKIVMNAAKSAPAKAISAAGRRSVLTDYLVKAAGRELDWLIQLLTQEGHKKLASALSAERVARAEELRSETSLAEDLPLFGILKGGSRS